MAFAAAGVVGLWLAQALAQRVKAAPTAAGGGAEDATARASGSRHGLGSSITRSADASPGQKARAPSLAAGMLVCFRDRHGQVAIISPTGNGRSWELVPTCASGGVVALSGHLSAAAAGHAGVSVAYVCADALFLTEAVGSAFAFRSLGAGGRYLATARDLHAPLLVDADAPWGPALWRLTGQGLVNAHHSHKRLGLAVHELKAVPSDALCSVARAYEAALASAEAQAAAAEAAWRALDQQLQELQAAALEQQQQRADEVSDLSSQLEALAGHNSSLVEAARQRNADVEALADCLAELQRVYKASEAELTAAYATISRLQQERAEQQDVAAAAREQALRAAADASAAAHAAALVAAGKAHEEQLAALAARHSLEAQDWAEMRAGLEARLLAQEQQLAGLAAHASRLEHALQDIKRAMVGGSRWQQQQQQQQQQHESLDAASVLQLQAAVAQFASDAGSPQTWHGSSSQQQSGACELGLPAICSSGSSIDGNGTQHSCSGSSAGVDESADVPSQVDASCCDQTSPGKQPGSKPRLHDSPDDVPAHALPALLDQDVGCDMTLAAGSATSGRAAQARRRQQPPPLHQQQPSPPAGVPAPARTTSSRALVAAASSRAQARQALQASVVSSSGRRPDGSSVAASDEHGVHRYSHDDLSDGDSKEEAAGADAGSCVSSSGGCSDGRGDDDELNAIHSLGQSMEEQQLAAARRQRPGSEQMTAAALGGVTLVALRQRMVQAASQIPMYASPRKRASVKQ